LSAPSPEAAPTPVPTRIRRVSVHVRAGLDAELERLRALAADLGVEVGDEEPDLAVVLGGDGAMLRAL